METKKAIKHFEDEIRFCERATAGNIVQRTEDWTLTLEANKAALAALREKQERENPKPLTEEELRWMMGQPVWIVPIGASGKWAIMSNSLLSLRAGYLAYRYKPEEVQP